MEAFVTGKMHKQSDLTVYEFTITKKSLIGIDGRDRMFFVLLGVSHNEIIILNKITSPSAYSIETQRASKGRRMPYKGMSLHDC